MKFDCNEGDCIQIGGNKLHLWVIISPKCGLNDEVVIVNITTKRFGSDTTTIIYPGDHPFIKQESVIFYADAQIVKSETIIEKAESGYFPIEKAKFSKELTEKIRNQAVNSPYTPKKILSFLKKHKLFS